MPKFEVTLVIGTTQIVEAEDEHEAVKVVRNETYWPQCDIDRLEVVEIKPPINIGDEE